MQLQRDIVVFTLRSSEYRLLRSLCKPVGIRVRTIYDMDVVATMRCHLSFFIYQKKKLLMSHMRVRLHKVVGQRHITKSWKHKQNFFRKNLNNLPCILLPTQVRVMLHLGLVRFATNRGD